MAKTHFRALLITSNVIFNMIMAVYFIRSTYAPLLLWYLFLGFSGLFWGILLSPAQVPFWVVTGRFFHTGMDFNGIVYYASVCFSILGYGLFIISLLAHIYLANLMDEPPLLPIIPKRSGKKGNEYGLSEYDLWASARNE